MERGSYPGENGGLGSNVTLTGTSCQRILSMCKDWVNVRMCEKIGADDTLIVIVVVENYTFDHMFTKCRFHHDDNWAVGINNSAVSDFDFATYWELKGLLVQCAFNEA
uniref:Uncharacterized protein n=1 Tax=Romanomermis culicivorax TaxID=13658 RepID=A0A915HRG1_ROMCU